MQASNPSPQSPGASTVPGTAGYGERAAELATQYESITFEQVYRGLHHLFPSSPVVALDIGAGTGRDAAALARRGHRVTAVEPTAELRAAGQRLHASLDIQWIDDHLPELRLLRETSRRFDLILLTAVWMHLDEAERATAMQALATLTADQGRIFMSLRHGPVPEGRRMFDVSAQETVRLAARHGLLCDHLGERDDTLGRRDIRWSILSLHRAT